MSETELGRAVSLIDRVRQMAGDSASAAQWHEESSVILPDGYRRRSPVQHCRKSPSRLPKWAVALLVLLGAALVALAVIVILKLIR